MREKRFVNILAGWFKNASYKVRVDAQPKPTLKSNEYECDRCHNVYEKGWSDADSRAEAEAIFGKPVAEWTTAFAIICDDCFKLIHPLKVENADNLLRARAELSSTNK